MFLKLYRTLKSGWVNLIRNGWLSIATVSIIAITLFIVNVQVAIIAANDFLLKDVKDKVSISIYFNTESPEEEILKVKTEIETYPEVSSVRFISKEEALSEFKNQNESNETIKKALEELGENPLGALLSVKSENPDNYDSIVKKVEETEHMNLISKINYQKYKGVIDSLNAEVNSNQKVAVILGITLSVIAILVTFNSIRITMYSHRQEIEIMKLVGASNNYIRMPFVWEGIFYGFLAAVIAIPSSYFYLKFISEGGASNSILPFSNTRYIQVFLSDYFVKYLLYVILGQILLSILLGVISSIIAIRKYLKV